MTRTERGFTLLEVLVAFVIAAFFLVALYEGSTAGLQAARLATDYQNALSRARSHMAALLVPVTVSSSMRQGDDGDGFKWETQVTTLGLDLQSSRATEGSGPRPVLYGLRVKISWQRDGGPHSLTLLSERIGPTIP